MLEIKANRSYHELYLGSRKNNGAVPETESMIKADFAAIKAAKIPEKGARKFRNDKLEFIN